MIHLVQQYFGESAARFPEKPAVCCDAESLTFREADALSNALARALVEAGVRRGQLVPFFLAKSVRSVLAILGILKADCAYVPLDARSPAQRLRSILAATAAPVVIVDDGSQAAFEALVPAAERPRLVNVSRVERGDPSPVACRNLSIDVAYVLFTSGSTGVPKGVLIPHRAIIDYIDWCVETYGLGSADVVSNHAPLYFDNSTFDLYCAFKAGATLHLVHDELNAVVPSLVRWLADREITTFFCVPSVLSMLLRSRRLKPGCFPRLRHVIAAGEVLPRDVLAAWMDLFPHVQFTNMYGPTEITVDCSYHVVHERPGPDVPSIPIGKARTNMELFVRTAPGALSQAPGAEGELLVRGTSVAYGYLGDAERTARAFIQNPLHRVFHDPLYCTGDLVRIDARGDYLFLGRADDQIKFLGYRIELGEIEASLLRVEGVLEGVVVFNDSPDEAARELGALVSLDAGCSVEAVREALKQRLPAYMVPTRLVPTGDELPRTPNGKYDRKGAAQLVFRAPRPDPG